MKFAPQITPFPLVQVCAVRMISLFLFTNLTGFLFSRVLAPDVVATLNPMAF